MVVMLATLVLLRIIFNVNEHSLRAIQNFITYLQLYKKISLLRTMRWTCNMIIPGQTFTFQYNVKHLSLLFAHIL